jgi:hypothetical protein
MSNSFLTGGSQWRFDRENNISTGGYDAFNQDKKYQFRGPLAKKAASFSLVP